MKIRTAPLVALAITTTALLSGCTGGITLTSTAEVIADTAENALEAQVGSRPDIDCGTGEVTITKGAKFDCELTDPATGEIYESPVTISAVDGTDFTVSVQVADAPK